MSAADFNALATDEPRSARDLRSVMLYAETTLVDYGGLMEGTRLNATDHDNLTKLQDAGFLTWGRVPGAILGQMVGRQITHWVEFTESGWEVAHQLRRQQCQRSRDFSINYTKFLGARKQ